MKRKRYDGTALRRVLVGMITNKVVLGRISSRWTSGGLFDASWANLVGGWCVDYYQKHQEAPEHQIQPIYQGWAETSARPEETVDAVEKFLLALSDEQREYSSEYLLDLAGDYFNSVRTAKACEEAMVALDRGDSKVARDRLAQLRDVQLSADAYSQPAADFEIWQQAFEHNDDQPLVKYPGAVGEYFADAFKRGEFYAFMGPDKTAKTTNLVDFTWRALRQRRKVAFFDAGDSSRNEMLLRFACRVTGRPDYGAEVIKPIAWSEEGELEFVHEKVSAVTAEDAYRAVSKRVPPDNWRLECHPNSSLSVSDLDGILVDWAADGWVPDVVVVDYADILKAPGGVYDGLEKIDETWKHMRRLSQQRHCLLLTATQSNAAAYGQQKGLLSRANFSGRKTKLAEVNGMIGINVSDDERATHQARWNWVVRRKMRNRRGASFVRIAGCYDTENPIIISQF